MAGEETVGTVERYIKDLKADEALTHSGLTLVPLSGNGNAALDYLLSFEAMDAGLLKVTEVGAHGTVPELMVTSTAETNVLLIDGEELIGAKQNRILNTTILLAAKAKTKIPVSCVEQGRWQHVSDDFKSGVYSPATLRGRKSRDVAENLRACGEARSDQGAVWDAVDETLEAADAHSPTMAMHDLVDARRTSIGEYLEKMACPAGARGVIAAVGGRLAAVDLFDKPETLSKLWKRLVTGYAMDAIGWREGQGAKDEFGTDAAMTLLKTAGEVLCQAFPSVGEGQDWRFSSESIVGQALVANGCCVHLSIFPNDEGPRGGGRREAIQPPSARRRHKRGQGGDIVF